MYFDKSLLYRLRYNNKIVGMRAVYYDISSCSMHYFDFYTSKIKDTAIQKFLVDNSSKFQILELGLYSGLIATEDEYKNNYAVTELDNTKDVEDLLRKIIFAYEMKNINSKEV